MRPFPSPQNSFGLLKARNFGRLTLLPSRFYQTHPRRQVFSFIPAPSGYSCYARLVSFVGLSSCDARKSSGLLSGKIVFALIPLSGVSFTTSLRSSNKEVRFFSPPLLGSIYEVGADDTLRASSRSAKFPFSLSPHISFINLLECSASPSISPFWSLSCGRFYLSPTRHRP